MKFSIATISLPTLTPGECAAAIKSAGFAGVEWRVEPKPGSVSDPVPAHPFLVDHKGTVPLTIEAARDAAVLTRHHGLELVGLAPYVEVGDHPTLRLVAAMTRAAGAPQFRLQAPRISRTGLPYPALFLQTMDFFAAVESEARAHGVRALLEIHHNTICPSAALAYRLVSHFDPRHVGVIYDLGNLVFEGYEDHGIALDLLGPYVGHVHLKNAAHFRAEGGGWKAGWTPLEDGEVRVPEFLALLRGRGYDGWVSIEDMSLDRSPLGTLRHNAAQLREWGSLG
jgi:sugar phosphate isomerase/epimerase